MTQLSSKFDFEDLDESEKRRLKTLPNAFDDSKDEMSFAKSLIISLILHPLCVFLIWLTVVVLTLLGLIIPQADRPDWKKKDLEFVIVTNEAEPIDKNTKYRSDRNSRAGGKHDPTKRVSEPSPSPSPAPKAPTPAPAPAPSPVQKPTPKPAPQQKAPVKRPVQTPAPVQKPVQQPKPAPAKPTQAKAPVHRPSYKPATELPKPSMPKLATAPKSPFSVAVPKTNAPVGPRPSAGGGNAAGGRTASGGTAGKGTGSYMPSPQLSPSRGSGQGSAGSRAGSGSKAAKGTGGYGTGNMGNPGPGNPSGPPGIDAIKSPNWGPYMRDLERRIKQNWNPPKGDASKRVVVLFKIGRDGRLLSIRIGKSSGSVSNDDAAKAAIELTAPFKPLPPEFKGSSIDIEFTFDYNVLGASYR